jgi:cytoskeleton protein RodZ
MSAEQTTVGAGSGASLPESADAAAAATAATPDRAADGPGARLRAAREARQLGIQQVTDLLHIEPRLIAAMEAEDFAAFDAPVYARGFLRKYAAFLEVPGDEIVAAYERLHSGPGNPSLIPPATAEEPRRDWSALKVPLAIAAMLVLVGGSYWWWLARAPGGDAERPTPAVAGPAVPAPLAPASPVDGPDTTGVATAPAIGGGEVTAAVGTVVPAGVPVGTVAPPPSVPSGAALEIDFVGDCWVEVTGPSGQRLMYDLGRAGQSRALPGPGPWRVFLGAADAARLRVAGRPVAVPPANRSGPTARLVVAPDGSVQ